MAQIGTGKLVTVFGASGFVGRHVVRALAARGYRVRAACRRPDLAGHLQPLGAVGQIQLMQANLRHPWSVERAVEGADAVINLVGILFEKGKQDFEQVQHLGAKAVAEAAKTAKVSRLVHMSAIGADNQSDSEYQRSKAAGEAAVTAAFKGAVIARPSIIFGPEDEFFNRFARLNSVLPILPLIGKGDTMFQPAYVGDVAEFFARAVDGDIASGAYELGGPDQLSFRECMQTIQDIVGVHRPLFPIPVWLAKIEAWFLEFLPVPPLTVDQVRSLQIDNVVSPAMARKKKTFDGVGMSPQSLHALLPQYLYCYRPQGQYAALK